jgi:hypothetical protein
MCTCADFSHFPEGSSGEKNGKNSPEKRIGESLKNSTNAQARAGGLASTPDRFQTHTEHRIRTTHILRTRTGPVVTGTFDEAAASFCCEWEPWPLTSQQLDAVLPEYEAWRDAIFADWSRRSRLNVLLVTL